MACKLLFVSFFVTFSVIAESRKMGPSRTMVPRINVVNVSDWETGVGTWYGPPNGAGSSGGACGYGELEGTPFDSNIIAIGDQQFNGGLGCGACYEVRCIDNDYCREESTNVVVVTDRCPECPADHLDFSGAGFGRLATDGQADALRDSGIVTIQYRRTNCNFPVEGITFQVDQGSNDFWVAFLVKYVPGYGELRNVEVMSAGSSDWAGASQLWGAVWQIQGPLIAPTMIRLTTGDGEIYTCAANGIETWAPGEISTCGATTS